MEHRITGCVLQNLTAIIRIGEHAARAVRATVEKLLEMTSALAQSVTVDDVTGKLYGNCRITIVYL